MLTQQFYTAKHSIGTVQAEQIRHTHLAPTVTLNHSVSFLSPPTALSCLLCKSSSKKAHDTCMSRRYP